MKTKKAADGAEEKGAPNRRKYPRVFVRVLVDFESRDTYLYDYSANLSEGGIFIETPKPFPIGSEITLRFTLPDIDRVFEAPGRVAWHKDLTGGAASAEGVPFGAGMGVEFTGLDDSDRIEIRRYIETTAAG